MNRATAILLASTALTGAGSSAFAAPIYSWTGFYLGANAGGVWDSSSATDQATFFLGPNFFLRGDNNTLRPTGPIGGIQAGYNWQTSSWVFGIEADIAGASANATANYLNPSFINVIQSARLAGLGTIRGRVGWDFGGTLAYVTGGAAFADLKNSITTPVFGLVMSRNGWETGWTVGGGVERAITSHWSAKLEYLFAQFPDETTSSPRGYSFKFRNSAQTLRVGVNYKY